MRSGFSASTMMYALVRFRLAGVFDCLTGFSYTFTNGPFCGLHAMLHCLASLFRLLSDRLLLLGVCCKCHAGDSGKDKCELSHISSVDSSDSARPLAQ
jgi:hypothetical protein